MGFLDNQWGGGRTAFGQLDEIELLAFLGPRYVRRQKGIHEGFEIGSPPLRQCVTDLPLIIDALARELTANGREPLVEPQLEPFDLVVFRLQIVTRPVQWGFPPFISRCGFSCCASRDRVEDM